MYIGEISAVAFLGHDRAAGRSSFSGQRKFCGLDSKSVHQCTSFST